MTRLVTTSFTKYELTPEETLQYSIVPETYKLILQNLLCECAEHKVALKYDPTNPTEFIQVEAELQGKIGIINLLLNQSKDAEIALLQSRVNS